MSAPLRIGSLFTGYGGLDSAALHLLGEESRVVWHSEYEPPTKKNPRPGNAAARLLEFRDPGVPNLGDITKMFPASGPIPAHLFDLATEIDALTFGWPCQPFSPAGKRLGEEDPRALWPNVRRCVAELRPSYLFGENVARVASNGELRRVVQDLATLGYVGTYRTLRASDVGATHRRDRLFLFAVRADADGTLADTFGQQLRLEQGRGGRAGGEGAGVVGDDGPQRPTDLTLLPTPTANHGDGRGFPSPAVAQRRRDAGRRMLEDAIALLPTPAARDGRRGQGWGDQPGRPLSETIHRLLPTPTATAAKGGRNATAGRSEGAQFNSGWTLSDVAYADRFGQYAAAIQRWEQVLGRPAPEPTQTGAKGGRVLAATWVEWMMGLPAGWVTEVPGLTRSQQIQMLGNGVVPQQAVAAFTELTARMFHVEHVAA